MDKKNCDFAWFSGRHTFKLINLCAKLRNYLFQFGWNVHQVSASLCQILVIQSIRKAEEFQILWRQPTVNPDQVDVSTYILLLETEISQILLWREHLTLQALSFAVNYTMMSKTLVTSWEVNANKARRGWKSTLFMAFSSLIWYILQVGEKRSPRCGRDEGIPSPCPRFATSTTLQASSWIAMVHSDGILLSLSQHGNRFY